MELWTVQYEDSYRLCYVRGPEGIVVALAEQLIWSLHRWSLRRTAPWPGGFLSRRSDRRKL